MGLLLPLGLTHADECHLTPVIHVLQYPGCIPKPIPSFACTGRCTSYVQVSGSKIWQTERSCMCCQESGEREANVLCSVLRLHMMNLKLESSSQELRRTACVVHALRLRRDPSWLANSPALLMQD